MAMIRRREGKKKNADGKVKKTVTWQAVVRKEDHRPKYKSFKTKRGAEVWATSVEDAINKDEFVPSAESSSTSLAWLLIGFSGHTTHFTTVLPSSCLSLT